MFYPYFVCCSTQRKCQVLSFLPYNHPEFLQVHSKTIGYLKTCHIIYFHIYVFLVIYLITNIPLYIWRYGTNAVQKAMLNPEDWYETTHCNWWSAIARCVYVSFLPSVQFFQAQIFSSCSIFKCHCSRLFLQQHKTNLLRTFVVRDCWVSGLCRSSGILKNATFRKLDLSSSSGEGVDPVIEVSSFWRTQQSRYVPPLHLRVDRDPVSETLCSSEYRKMDKVRKPSNPEFYKPSSESFRNSFCRLSILLGVLI
jgi:hypothetical protein